MFCEPVWSTSFCAPAYHFIAMDQNSKELVDLIQDVYRTYRSDFEEEVDSFSFYLMENSDVQDISSSYQSNNDKVENSAPSSVNHVKLKKKNGKKRFLDLEDIPLQVRMEEKKINKAKTEEKKSPQKLKKNIISPDESNEDEVEILVPSIADHAKLRKRNSKSYSELENIPPEERMQEREMNRAKKKKKKVSS